MIFLNTSFLAFSLTVFFPVFFQINTGDEAADQLAVPTSSHPMTAQQSSSYDDDDEEASDKPVKKTRTSSTSSAASSKASAGSRSSEDQAELLETAEQVFDFDVFRTTCMHTRVTSCVCEKIAQNVAQPVFLTKFMLKLIHGI
jgi:hypothetical protein